MKILIADDDSISRRMMERMLLRAGYDVVTSADGGEAVERLLGNDAPRLALLDWMMPGMDGLAVCRELRRIPERAYTYIALLTSRDAKEDLIAGLEAGADDYLTKPCNLHELEARLRTGQRILRMEDTLVAAREGMRFKATHDPLTSLWNRGAIVAHLEAEINCVQQGGGTLSLLLCDVDHFKLFNDRHGHLVGDAVLREIANRLTAAVKPGDPVGRYGGEEFLVLLRDCDEQAIRPSADRVRLGVCSYPIAVGAEQLPLSVSIGAINIGRSSNCNDIQSVLGQVDAALYRAKMEGRNQVVVSASGLDPEAKIDVPNALALSGARHSQTRLSVRPF